LTMVKKYVLLWVMKLNEDRKILLLCLFLLVIFIAILHSPFGPTLAIITIVFILWKAISPNSQ
jgi:hypothetical protein